MKEACGCAILGRETARRVRIGGTSNTHEHEYRTGKRLLSFIETQSDVVTLVTYGIVIAHKPRIQVSRKRHTTAILGVTTIQGPACHRDPASRKPLGRRCRCWGFAPATAWGHTSHVEVSLARELKLHRTTGRECGGHLTLQPDA